MSARATASDRLRPLPGDRFVHDFAGDAMHAVSIAAPSEAVWPWLVQMGAGRAGWYSYS